MTYHIVFCGGGTAGHVTPNIALIEILQPAGWTIDYIGTSSGVENAMITALNIPYHSIRSGKLRRYFSWKNFIDPINLLIGIVQSTFLLHRLKPDVVFSKGGFVSFPVVVGAWINRIPVVAHESDKSPGLANRLSYPFVSKICLTFASTTQHFKQQTKVAVTGTPIRQALFLGQAQKGRGIAGFNSDKPCLLVVGGSQGSTLLNRCIREALETLCQSFQIIHLCGKGNLEPLLADHADYCQLEYADQELPDLLAASDIVVSRAGANTLYELMVLKKPHVLVPLSLQASRGDQIQNAAYYKSKGISEVVDEASLTPQVLLKAINNVMINRETIVSKIAELDIQSATPKIIELLQKTIDSSYHF